MFGMILEFLSLDVNIPFTFALIFLVFLLALEICSLVIGISISSLVDVDVDAGYLTVLGLGKVPFIVWLVLFLGIFAVLGLVATDLLGSLISGISPWIVAVPVALAALPINAVSCRFIISMIPNSDSTVVSTDTFVGREGLVVTGNATYTDFAMGTVLDEHENSHNIRVQSIDEGVVLESGSKVILVEKKDGSGIWLAMPSKY